MKLKRKTTEFALYQCELGSNHYLIDLNTQEKSPFFGQSSELWRRLRYHTLTSASEFNTLARACIKTKETDLMIVERNLDN
jgi:hypothetical protein